MDSRNDDLRLCERRLYEFKMVEDSDWRGTMAWI
jgi:hypothetical protein